MFVNLLVTLLLPLLVLASVPELTLKGSSPMKQAMAAIQKGNVERIQLLLQGLIDPSADHSILLREAASSGQDVIVAVLLKDGRSDPGAKDSEAFRLACRNGHLSSAKSLLSSGRINLKAKRNYALRKASKYGHSDLVQWLIMIGADPAAQRNYAVTMAAARGHFDTIKVLREQPAVRCQEAVYAAAINNHGNIVKYLLPACYDNLHLARLGLSALHHAITNGHVEVVRALLKDGRTPVDHFQDHFLNVAAIHGHAQIVQLLLDDGRITESMDYCHALNFAAYHGHASVVSVLLQSCYRCDPGLRNSRPLRIAALQGHLETVRLLLADPRIQPSPKLNEVIKRVERSGNQAILEALLQDPRASLHWKGSSSSGPTVRRRLSNTIKNLSPRQIRSNTKDYHSIDSGWNQYSHLDSKAVHLVDSENSHSHTHSAIELD